MNRVLVTGASGFIGRQCITSLLKTGYEVHAADLRTSAETNLSCTWHQTDLLNEAQVTELMIKVRPSHLLHFAWYAEPGKYWTSLENFRWVRASSFLVEQFYHYGGERFVAAGTCAEYDWKDGHCSEQSTPLLPQTTYGICKHCLQTLVDAFSRQTGLSTAWGRLFFLYGPGEHPSRLVASVVHDLLEERLALCTHGNQIRDFLHVADAASAFIALLESKVAGAVNIASGKPLAIKDLVSQIARLMGRDDLLRLGAVQARENDPPILLADVRRLSEEVGWSPVFDLQEGLVDTIEQAKRNHSRSLRRNEPL